MLGLVSYSRDPSAEKCADVGSAGRASWSPRETSMKYRVVLIENEERSLARLRRLLSGFSEDVEVIGEAADGPSAVQVIRSSHPDLVFLDIDLPGFGGFEVLERLERQPAVIFTTAFNQHALHAFKAHAIDYLLKPIDVDAVGRALRKLRAMGVNQPLPETIQRMLETLQPSYLRRLSCKVGDKIVLLKTEEIVYFQADHKYTSVHTELRDFLIDTPLVDLERKLDPRDFIRIHRARLINLSWIDEIRRAYDGRLKVWLKDAKRTELSASRMYSDNLRNL